MFSSTEILLSLRYLKSRKRTGFVSVIAGFSFLGIMLGVATLIIVMSVMNGFRAELTDRVLGINGHLGIYPAWGGSLSDYQKIIQPISNPHITQIIPVIDGQAMVNSADNSAGVMVRATDAQNFAHHKLLAEKYTGEPLTGFQENTVIVGWRLARKLAVRPGDFITLVSPKGNITAFGTVPKMKSFKVLGTFDSGMFEYDDNFVFMPLSTAQHFFALPESITHIEVFVDALQNVQPVLQHIAENLSDTAQVYDWRHSNQSFFNAIEVERNVMFLILTLIIVVAAFNMISGLIMLVQDKAKDIAILRTMGMSKGGIMRVFLLSGTLVGFVGTLTGLGLGLAFCYNIDAIKTWLEGLSGRELFSAEIYFLSHLPAKVDLTEVAVVVGMALLLSVLATLYPAWKAGKTDPVEALRYE